jgi:hypothetical protein
MRTIILTEKQIKSAIDKVVSEQKIVRNEVRKPASLPPINIPYKFPAGYWMPTQQLVSQVTTALTPVIDFIKKYQSQKIEVSIQAGESQVTNADNEPKSKNKGKKVPQKYLANGRSNSIKSIIDNFFDNLIKTNTISVKPTFGENEIILGTTPYVVGKSNPNDPKYADEQFINVIVKATGESVTVEETCLIGLKIMIDYNSEWCKQDKNRCHACDESAYSIYANGIPVNNEKGSNLANLNNAGSGDSRIWVGVFNENDAKRVLQGDKKEIIFTYQCEADKGNGCHSDSMHVTIFDNTNQTLFSDFVSGGYRLKKSNGQRMLIKTDQCGKVLEVAPRLTADPNAQNVVKLTKEQKAHRWDFDYNNPVESMAKIYASIDSQGNIPWENFYDKVAYSNVIAMKKRDTPTWDKLLNLYSESLTRRQIKEIPIAAQKFKQQTTTN